MINTIMLVGRFVDVEEKEKYSIIKVFIQRRFKENDIYKNDIINIQVSNNLSIPIKEYIQKNDLIGVRGCLRYIDNKLIAVAESITLLSSKKEVKDETD